MEWRPIETAPKDEWFLAYEAGAYYKAKIYELNYDGDGNTAYETDCGQPTVLTCEPTHWMPLPTLPKQG